MADSMVFRLKDSVDDLASANEGMSKYSYDQIQTSSGTGTGPNFSNGQLRFKWEHASNKWWFPSKSYLQLRFQLSKGNDAKLTDATVAPNMNICASIFQQAEFQIGGKTVSKIGEYLPQVDSLKKRTTKSKAWLDGVGASTMLMQSSQADRSALATAKPLYGATWQPPLSIFDVDVLPGGMYELILTPESIANFQKFATEQVYGTAAIQPGAAATDFKFEVKEIFFYVCSADADRLDDKEYYVDLQACKMSIGQGTIGQNSQQQFDVSPSTNALTVAFQDKRAGFDPQASRTKFRANAEPDNAVNAFVPAELSLNRLFIQYAGHSQPVPDASPKFDATQDFTVRRYTESIMNSGLYWSEGSAESIEDFHERGSYYHFNTPKDPTDKSTRVSVYTGFSDPPGAGTDLANVNLLLFEHYKQVARIVLSQGRVVDVRLEDA